MYKKVLILVVLICFLSPAFLRQGSAEGGFLFQAGFSAPEAKNLEKKQEAGILNLIPNFTDSQKQKIKALLEEEREKIKEIRKEYKEKIEKVLTGEQLKALQDKFFEKMIEKRISLMEKVLNLTIEQQYKIKLIYKNYQNQLNLAKSKEGKIKILNEINKEIKKVLNDEQKAKWEKRMNIFKQKCTSEGTSNGPSL